MEKTRKFPWFWVIYILYILLLSGLICYGISWLWKFLAVYEASRPVHYMENSMHLFEESETEQLQEYLVNTADNPYEDISAILSVFYSEIENKELSFGKLSGAYTETHPVYAVLAEDRQVATVSFVSDRTDMGYNFYGWTVEAVSLLVTPTKSFAVTVPSSMTVTINGRPVSETHRVSTVETNTPVAYVNYACIGELYLEPDIQVTDRYGSVVSLQKDEKTGGLYYQLSYAKAPASMELSFGGHVLGEENTMTKAIEVEELDFVSQVAEHFSEYSGLSELVELPTFREYFIDFAFDAGSVAAKDRFGNTRVPEYDEASRTYSYGLISNDDLKEECVALATSFLETYSLFCAGDVKKTELKRYFPEDSEFYTTIVSMNNNWFTRHTPIRFTNHKLEKFFAYTDNLAYVHITMDQEFRLAANNSEKVITVNIPLWLVKLEDSWYIVRIIYDNYTEE